MKSELLRSKQYFVTISKVVNLFHKSTVDLIRTVLFYANI